MVRKCEVMYGKVRLNIKDRNQRRKNHGIWNKQIEKDVIKMLKEDEFMRISYVNRESNVLHYGKERCILYINADIEETSSIGQKLRDLGAEKITGTDERDIIDTIKIENAASGMGMKI